MKQNLILFLQYLLHLLTKQHQKTSQISLNQGQKELFNEDFATFESRVFLQTEGKIYIGGEIITEQMRNILRDQARTFQTTNLFEIINATTIKEGFNIYAQASNMEHIQYAKAIHYWNKALLKMINALAK